MSKWKLLLAAAIAALLALALTTPHLLLKPPEQPPAEQPAVQQPEQLSEQQPPVEQPPAEEQPVVEQPQQPPAEQPPRLIVARVEAGEGGRVLVNGSEVSEWSSHKPFTLVLEAVPEKGYAFDHWEVNGSPIAGQLLLNLSVAGNTTVKAVFSRAVFTAKFYNVVVPVRVNVTGLVYSGDFELGFNHSVAIEVAPHGADDAGCVLFNQTHKACLTGWLREPGEELRVRYLYARLTRDEVFRQLVKYVKAYYPPAVIEVIVGNTTVKTVAEPSKTLIVPFDATYEYVGDGWFHVKGDLFAFYVKMPPWRKLRIYVNYTAKTLMGGELPLYLTVVVRNGPVYLDVGADIGTIPTSVFTFDWKLVELYNNALEQCNFQRECTTNFFFSDKELYKLVTCQTLATGTPCKFYKVMRGPSERLEPGDWGTGDLCFDGRGELWIKIEVVE